MENCIYVPKVKNKSKFHYETVEDSALFLDLKKQYGEEKAIELYKDLQSDRFKSVYGDWVAKPNTVVTFDVLSTMLEENVDAVYSDNNELKVTLAAVTNTSKLNDDLVVSVDKLIPSRILIDNRNVDTKLIDRLVANNVDILVTDRSTAALLYLPFTGYKNYTVLTSKENTSLNAQGEPILSNDYLAAELKQTAKNQDISVNRQDIKAKKLTNIFSKYGVNVNVEYVNNDSSIQYVTKNGQRTAVIKVNSKNNDDIDVVHEFGHLYIDLLNNSVRQEAINELKNTTLWNEVYAESKTWLNDGLSVNQIQDKIQREILARAVENEYKALSKNVLKRIYAFFANLFGIPISKSKALAYDLLKEKVRIVNNLNTVLDLPTYEQFKLSNEEVNEKIKELQIAVNKKVVINRNSMNVEELQRWLVVEKDLLQFDKVASLIKVINVDTIKLAGIDTTTSNGLLSLITYVRGYENMFDIIDELLNEYGDSYDLDINNVKSKVNVKEIKEMSAKLRKTVNDIKLDIMQKIKEHTSIIMKKIVTNDNYQSIEDINTLLEENKNDISFFARWLDTLDETNDTVLQAVEKFIIEAKSKARLTTMENEVDITNAYEKLAAVLGDITSDNEQTYFDFMLEKFENEDGTVRYGANYINEFKSTYDLEKQRRYRVYLEKKQEFDENKINEDELKKAYNDFITWRNDNTEREYSNEYYQMMTLNDEAKEARDVIEAERRTIKSKYVQRRLDTSIVTEEDKKRLVVLKLRKKELASLYYLDGTKKGSIGTEEDKKALRIALEIKRYNETFAVLHDFEKAVDEFEYAYEQAKKEGRGDAFWKENTITKKNNTFYERQAQLSEIYLKKTETIARLEELNNEKRELLSLIRDDRNVPNPNLLEDTSMSLNELRNRIYEIEKEEYDLRYGNITPKPRVVNKGQERFILKDTNGINEKVQAIKNKFDKRRLSLLKSRGVLRGLQYLPSDLTVDDELELLKINNEEKYELRLLSLFDTNYDETLINDDGTVNLGIKYKESDYDFIPQMNEFDADKQKVTNDKGEVNEDWLKYNTIREFDENWKKDVENIQEERRNKSKNRVGKVLTSEEKTKRAKKIKAKDKFKARLLLYKNEKGEINYVNLINDIVEEQFNKEVVKKTNEGVILSEKDKKELRKKITNWAIYTYVKTNTNNVNSMYLPEDTREIVTQSIKSNRILVYENQYDAVKNSLNEVDKKLYEITDVGKSSFYKEAFNDAASNLSQEEFSKWFENNHIPLLDENRNVVKTEQGRVVFIPNELWSINEPKNKDLIKIAPAYRWRIAIPKSNIIDSVKTAAYNEYHNNQQKVTTDYYKKERKAIETAFSEGRITEEQYREWYENNHKFNKFSGEYEPISMWVETLATRPEHNETTYTPQWQNNVVKDDAVMPDGKKVSLKNKNYRVDEYGNPVPVSKWKNDNFQKLMNDSSPEGLAKREFYQWYVSYYNKLQGNYAPILRNNKMLPTALRTTSGDLWQDTKDAFNRFKDIKYDGKENIVLTDENNDVRYTLKALYSKKLTDENGNEDYSKRDNNLIKTLYMYAAAANKHKEFKEIEADLLLVKDRTANRNTEQSSFNPLNRKKNTVKGGRSYEALTDYLVQNFYNQRENTAGNFTLNKNVYSIDKLIERIKEYESLRTLGFGLRAGIANVMQGETTQVREAVANEYYGMSAYTKASTVYAENMVDTLGDTMRNKTVSKVNILNEIFDTFSDFDDKAREKGYGEKNNFKSLFKRSTAFFINSSGEHMLQSRNMLAVLMAHKLDENGKLIRTKNDEKSIYDTLEIKDGRITNLSNDEIVRISSKIKHINRIHGNYSEKVGADRYAYTSLMLMYRKWIKTGWNRRWRAENQYSELGETNIEGYYTTVAMFLKRMYEQRQNMSIEMLSNAFNSLNDNQKANFRRTYFDMGVVLLLHVLVYALAGLAEDDDDEQLYSAIAFFASRLESELLFFSRPDEAYKILKSPAASMSLGQDIGQALIRTVMIPAWGETYKRGKNKDELKIKKEYLDLVPLYKQFRNMTDLKDDSKTLRKNDLFKDMTDKENED